jgi:hypothetical protein
MERQIGKSKTKALTLLSKKMLLTIEGIVTRKTSFPCRKMIEEFF